MSGPFGVGTKIPDVTLRRFNENREATDLPLAPLFAGKKVVIFGLPGAFTPTCSAKHLPGYAANLEVLKSLGVDLVVCITPNDLFVADAWERQYGQTVPVLADGSLLFTRAAGLEQDLTGYGMGLRMRRFSALVENGEVKISNVEPGPGMVVSDAATMVKALGGTPKDFEAFCQDLPPPMKL